MNQTVPEDISARSGSPENFARELLLKLALKGNEQVLQIGSGDGKLTAAIAACLPRGSVLGIDPSETMVRSAQDTYASNRYNNIRFLVESIETIDAEGRFTCIVSVDMVNWVSDPTAFYVAVQQLLAPGGRLFIQMEGPGPTETILPRIEALIRRSPWNEYFEGYTLPYTLLPSEDMMGYCEDAGVHLLRLNQFSRSLLFDDEDLFAGWAGMFWSRLIEKVPDDQKSSFTRAIIGEYTLLYPASSEGRLSIPTNRIEIEARKGPGEI